MKNILTNPDDILEDAIAHYGVKLLDALLQDKTTKNNIIWGTSDYRDKAEVFTPSWVCNAQNNLVDNQWFGKKMYLIQSKTSSVGGFVTEHASYRCKKFGNIRMSELTKKCCKALILGCFERIIKLW